MWHAKLIDYNENYLIERQSASKYKKVVCPLKIMKVVDETWPLNYFFGMILLKSYLKLLTRIVDWHFLLTHPSQWTFLSLSDRCMVVCVELKVSSVKHQSWIPMKVFASVDCQFPSARRFCQRPREVPNHFRKVFSGSWSPATFQLRLKSNGSRKNGPIVPHFQDMLWQCSTTSQQPSIQCRN